MGRPSALVAFALLAALIVLPPAQGIRSPDDDDEEDAMDLGDWERRVPKSTLTRQTAGTFMAKHRLQEDWKRFKVGEHKWTIGTAEYYLQCGSDRQGEPVITLVPCFAPQDRVVIESEDIPELLQVSPFMELGEYRLQPDYSEPACKTPKRERQHAGRFVAKNRLQDDWALHDLGMTRWSDGRAEYKVLSDLDDEGRPVLSVAPCVAPDHRWVIAHEDIPDLVRYSPFLEIGRFRLYPDFSKPAC